MVHTDRNEINLKLIALVQNHEILYSTQKFNNSLFERRRELWDQISNEMNETFKLIKSEWSFSRRNFNDPHDYISNIVRNKLDVEDWKNKWRELRKYFIRTSAKPDDIFRRNPAFNKLHFLRPYVEEIIQARQRKSSGMSSFTVPTNLVNIMNIYVALFHNLQGILWPTGTYFPELPRGPSATRYAQSISAIRWSGRRMFRDNYRGWWCRCHIWISNIHSRSGSTAARLNWRWRR